MNDRHTDRATRSRIDRIMGLVPRTRRGTRRRRQLLVEATRLRWVIASSWRLDTREVS